MFHLFFLFHPHLLTTFTIKRDNAVRGKGICARSRKLEMAVTTDRLHATLYLRMLHGNNREQQRNLTFAFLLF